MGQGLGAEALLHTVIHRSCGFQPPALPSPKTLHSSFGTGCQMRDVRECEGRGCQSGLEMVFAQSPVTWHFKASWKIQPHCVPQDCSRGPKPPDFRSQDLRSIFPIHISRPTGQCWSNLDLALLLSLGWTRTSC
jgi:hypothetical protein